MRGVRRGWTRSALTLSGTLRTAAGVPASGVLVTLFAHNADQAAAQAVTTTTTDAAGHWVLSRRAARRVRWRSATASSLSG